MMRLLQSLVSSLTVEPWWYDKASDAALLLLGAIIGLFAGFAKEWSDDRRAKRAFLAAVRSELAGLLDQLKGSQNEIVASMKRCTQDPRSEPPQFAAGLRTTVFWTMLAKLRDLDDPVALRIVAFYSDLHLVEDQRVILNQNSLASTQLNDGERQKASYVRIMSALQVLAETVPGFVNRCEGLLADLKKAGYSPDT